MVTGESAATLGPDRCTLRVALFGMLSQRAWRGHVTLSFTLSLILDSSSPTMAGVTRTDWRQLSAARSDVCRAPHRGHLTAAVVSMLPKAISMPTSPIRPTWRE